MFGVTEKAKAMADIGCYIPMEGFTDSFNISHAAAIMMYHAVRDRVTKQVIIRRSLSTYHSRYFWAVPFLQRFSSLIFLLSCSIFSFNPLELVLSAVFCKAVLEGLSERK
jgi:hypothetical protein